jgi:dTDP-4-dehydrorhamnose 3,5-epimerase
MVLTCHLPGLLILEPKVFGDTRGYFLETYHAKRYHEIGVDAAFVQDNISFSRKGILRGLHFQNPHTQGKLVTVLEGEVFDVTVDIRQNSTTFGQWYGIHLNGENKRQLFVPAGFAHGFQVLSDTVLFHYKCTDFYSPQDEHCIRWNDPDLAIEWPIKEAILSNKDTQAPFLRELSRGHLL